MSALVRIYLVQRPEGQIERMGNMSTQQFDDAVAKTAEATKLQVLCGSPEK